MLDTSKFEYEEGPKKLYKSVWNAEFGEKININNKKKAHKLQ